jgi:sortase B
MSEENNKFLLITKRILNSIIIVIILYCIYQIGKYMLESKSLDKSIDAVVPVNTLEKYFYPKPISKETESAKDRYATFLGINKDVTGWINIPGTKIDYPVVKSSDNDFYLNHNIKKEQAVEGSIFMDYRNKGDGTDRNTIIYGHNMKDGSMFKALMGYKNKDFLNKHPVVTFNTLDKDVRWEVFSAYVTDTSFYYIKTDFSDDKDFEQLLKELKERSLYDTGVNVTKDDKILTLSTCSYEFEDARFAIHAKMIK